MTGLRGNGDRFLSIHPAAEGRGQLPDNPWQRHPPRRRRRRHAAATVAGNVYNFNYCSRLVLLAQNVKSRESPVARTTRQGRGRTVYS